MFVDKYAWCKEILERRHHTLIAGCSGAGKSVAEHDIIYTAMLNKPNDNCFVFIDTKMVELDIYKDSPHCAKYVDDIDEVYFVLKSVHKVMENRYERMKANRERVSSEPTLWIVIDELYDVFALADKRCKTVLSNIASKGRAAGVLLLCCTQRCANDTITPMVKTNFSTRLGLRTVTAQDSRNILQVKGCENLPKYGKGILQIDGINKEVDIPLTEDKDIEERIGFWLDVIAKDRQ